MKSEKFYSQAPKSLLIMGNVLGLSDDGYSESSQRASGRKIHRPVSELDRKLREFGEDLDAPPFFRDHATESANTVFHKLRQCSKYELDSTLHYAGSFGKQTDVLEPDLDLVIIIKNLDTPSYQEVLDDFEGIISSRMDELTIRAHSLQRQSRFSLQFTFHGGYEVDLLPAADISPENIYEALERNPEKYYNYSSALVQRQLAFMKCHQTRFTLTIIRLTKFWLKSLNLGKRSLKAGCTIMELICVAVAKEEEDQYELFSCSVLRTLLKVIDMITNLDKLKLAFQEVSPNQWSCVHNFSENMVPKVVGTREILNRKCFIVEPANPFNDLLAHQGSDIIRKLKRFAEVTKDRLSELKQLEQEGHAIDFVKLFEPQTVNLSRQSSTAIPDYVRVEYEYNPLYYPTKSVEVRDDALLTKEMDRVVRIVTWHLRSLIHSTVCPVADPDFNVTNAKIQEIAVDFLKSKVTASVNSKNVQKGFGSTEGKMDVTILIPYSVKGHLHNLICGMSWKNWKEITSAVQD